MIEDIKIIRQGNIVIVVVELEESVDNKDAILAELNEAKLANADAISAINASNTHIKNAEDLLNEDPPEGDEVEVADDDDIVALVQSYPPDTKFICNDDFSQDVGEWHINKPCYIEGGTLIGSITCDAPDIQFQDVTFNGTGGTILQLGHRTILNNCELNGHPTLGQQRGINANHSDGAVITDTRILNIFKDQDTQAICGWDGTKNLTVTGCELEASGENVMFGGADCSSEENIPTNILIEECHFSKKMSWREDPSASCKNLFELKNAIGVRVKHCTFENSFVDGQIGYGLVLTVRNQDGGNPYATVKDVLIEDCTFSHLAGGIQILGRDDSNESRVMENVVIRDTAFYDIDPSKYGNNGKSISISGGPKNLTFERVTFEGVHLNSAFYFSQPEHLTEGLIVSDSEFVEGSWGIMGDGGSPGVGSLNMYAPGTSWIDVRVHKSGENNITWPDGTTFV